MNHLCDVCRPIVAELEAELTRLRAEISVFEQFKKEIRTIIADHIRSEGCGCCLDSEQNDKTTAALARMLNVSEYVDGSGFDWSQYQTEDKEVK